MEDETKKMWDTMKACGPDNHYAGRDELLAFCAFNPDKGAELVSKLFHECDDPDEGVFLMELFETLGPEQSVDFENMILNNWSTLTEEKKHSFVVAAWRCFPLPFWLKLFHKSTNTHLRHRLFVKLASGVHAEAFNKYTREYAHLIGFYGDERDSSIHRIIRIVEKDE